MKDFVFHNPLNCSPLKRRKASDHLRFCFILQEAHIAFGDDVHNAIAFDKEEAQLFLKKAQLLQSLPLKNMKLSTRVK